MKNIHSPSKATTALRILLPLASAAWVLFIFSQSGQTGAQSGAASQQLAAWLSGASEPAPGTSLESTLRKLGHLAEYALLGLLLMAALRAFTRRTIAYSGWPLLFGLGIATLDETYQLFVPDRSGAVSDVLLDLGGLLAGMALACAAIWLYQRLKKTTHRGAATTG